jgi:hypothetical protein
MGHHEEGVEMRGELDELQRRLDTNFPSLAWLVEIELETPSTFCTINPNL